MGAIKKTVKKQLGNLWNDKFPTFVHWQPGHLVRRHGPLLVGVAIEPASTDRTYHAIFHIHNMASEFPVISLALAGRLVGRSGMPEEMSRNTHEMSERRVFERFASQYPLVAVDSVTFKDYVRTTRNYVTGRHGRSADFEVWPYHDLLVTAAWCGYKEYVIRNLDAALKAMAGWEERNCFDPWGGKRAWQDKIIALAGDSQGIDQTIRAEVERHGLQSIPDRGLMLDAEPEDLL